MANKKETDELLRLLEEQKELEILKKSKSLKETIDKAEKEAKQTVKFTGVMVGKTEKTIKSNVTDELVNIKKYEVYELTIDGNDKITSKQLIHSESNEAVAFSKATQHLTSSYMKGTKFKTKKEQ
jgi:NCAIR mutase (PurE)-related protein